MAADSTLVVLDKNAAIYLEETVLLFAQSAGNDLDVVCSYEEISNIEVITHGR